MTFVNLTAVFGSIILVGSYCIVTLHYSQSTASLCGVASQALTQYRLGLGIGLGIGIGIGIGVRFRGGVMRARGSRSGSSSGSGNVIGSSNSSGSGKGEGRSRRRSTVFVSTRASHHDPALFGMF